MNDLFSLKHKTAIVTGGGSGIGQAIALALSKAHANIIIVGKVEQELQETKNEISSSGKCDTVLADLLDENSIDRASKVIIEKHGTPDIIVNAAGINLRQAPQDITSASWDQTLGINLKVPFFFAKAFMDGMQQRGSGKIINISSLQSVRAFDDSIPYGASKGGVNQLTRAMAQAYSPHGVQVNAIAPGFFETKLTSSLYGNRDKLDQLASSTAIGRNGLLTDFNGLAVFLSSSASDYITGQTIFLDGGFTAK